jgi:hypothetical protein
VVISPVTAIASGNVTSGNRYLEAPVSVPGGVGNWPRS